MIGEEKVLDLTAIIPDTTKVGNINQYVENIELYEANRAEVRRDIAEFQDMVYEIEDSLLAESLEK